ncbi:hypothetical protein V8B55DRAFT_1058589 [Mucor lusitanicus]|uniref:RING-type domain-containing protein n=2 Tax=Mucor circinelloides f. lusitanicus TaxID=29924 RepID=A0A8H4B8C0_MUCCL|nr:hypothetical protein FB192DRAFT_1402603 [Mucor lusitanicus]
MGQRQSSQSSDPTENSNDTTMNEANDNNNNDTNENTTSRRGRIFRPSARLNVERNNPISRASNESQRRSERRTRRARLREEQLNATTPQEQQQQQEEGGGEGENEEAGLAALMSSVIEALDAVAALARNRPTTAAATASTNISNIATTTTTSTSEESAESVNSPFARMIAQVMSEAVLASFRSGQISTPTPNDSQARQQLTMHLPADLFRQMEPGRSEDVFLRPFRLPILITPISGSTEEENNGNAASTNGGTSGNSSSNSSGSNTRNTRSTAVNADGEAPTLNEGNSQVSQLMFLPVLICGRRSAGPSTTSIAENASTTMSLSDFLNTNNESTNENTQRPGTRSSTRIRERQQRQQESSQQGQEQQRSRTASTDTLPGGGGGGGGQWTVWILSGPRVESFMSDNPTYEDLIQLADLLGPARLPTVTQEAIDSHIPIVKYTQQVKQSMVGNTEGCQVCLDSYQSEDYVRVLECHHGFHKDCIDKWLTEGQNRCPLCRGVPIPSDSSPPTTND